MDSGIFKFILQEIKAIRDGSRRRKMSTLIPKAAQCWRESEGIGKVK